MASFFSRLRANKHFKNGLPFFLFIGGGAFALKEFRTVRYDSNINIRANKLLTPEEAFGERAKDVDFKPKRSLEEELDVLKEKVDINNWENKRGPRPWEDSRSFQGAPPAKPKRLLPEMIEK
jgi:cytochrome c oxidase assembly protein subunit 16